MKKLIVRALSGLVFVLVVCGFIFFGEFGHAALFLLVSIIGLGEFYRALSKQGVKLSAPLGVVVGTMLYLVVTGVVVFNLSSLFLLSIIPLFMVVFLAHLWKKTEKPFESIAYTICGVVYVSIPLSLTIFLAKPIFMDSEVVMFEYLPLTMFGILMLQWVSDSFAYLTGVCIGKHPLFPRHSPKKSWEGFIGGFVFTVLAGYLIGTYLSTHYTVVDWMAMGAMVPIIGTLGDLVESMFKRSMGIKDTGNIMPGHGGLLDRFDSLLMTTPFLLAYLLIKYLLF
ncbi:MAG: phosphatidate cytidylyltransferase [Bacteroidales bacterium]|nr:phosphatidate cytidylyltransferase [Bacteroidales bacterium]